MTTIFFTVTDLELLASQVVKIILFVLIVFGVGFNVFKVWNEKEGRRKILRGSIALTFLALSIPLIKWIKIDGSLLYSDQYAAGISLGYCQVLGKGKGIEFEYVIAGIKYNNCNTFHPISIENIEVPGGRYYVRYSKKYPDKGRIDFNRPVQ